MTRRAVGGDLDVIGSVAIRSGLFTSAEWGGVGEIVRGCVAGESDGEVWVAERGGLVIGVAYVAPEPFASSMWNLYLLAVDGATQGTGAGAGLVGRVESQARSAGVRSLIVETSGVASFARTRSFYEGLGFAREGRIRDFYGPDDDKVVYWKSLTPAPAALAVEAARPVAFVGAGRDGRVTVWSPAAEALVGYPAAAVIGRDVAMLVPDEFRARHQQGFTVAMSGRARGPASAPFHLPVVCADGVERVFAARFTVLDDPHGTPCGALVLLSHARSDAEPWTPVEP